MNPEDNRQEPAASRAEVIESIRRDYGEVTFYDLTTVIAGGMKHMVPEGTTFISGQTRARQARSAKATNKSTIASGYALSPPGTEETARKRREAIEALRLEYGDATYYDSATVIAGGKKHQVPEGTVFFSAPAEWRVGRIGGIYKEWYSLRTGLSRREYFK